MVGNAYFVSKSRKRVHVRMDKVAYVVLVLSFLNLSIASKVTEISKVMPGFRNVG